jgi:hypothetical protein
VPMWLETERHRSRNTVSALSLIAKNRRKADKNQGLRTSGQFPEMSQNVPKCALAVVNTTAGENPCPRNAAAGGKIGKPQISGCQTWMSASVVRSPSSPPPGTPATGPVRPAKCALLQEGSGWRLDPSLVVPDAGLAIHWLRGLEASVGKPACPPFVLAVRCVGRWVRSRLVEVRFVRRWGGPQRAGSASGAWNKGLVSCRQASRVGIAASRCVSPPESGIVFRAARTL